MRRLDAALYSAIHAFGIEAMAEKMRITPQVLINKLNPEIENYRLTFEQFLIALEETRSDAVWEALAEQVGRSEFEVQPSMVLAVLAAAKESNDVLAVFNEGAADGSWSNNDARRFEAEVNQAVEALGEAAATSWQLAKQGGHLNLTVMPRKQRVA